MSRIWDVLQAWEPLHAWASFNRVVFPSTACVHANPSGRPLHCSTFPSSTAISLTTCQRFLPDHDAPTRATFISPLHSIGQRLGLSMFFVLPAPWNTSGRFPTWLTVKRIISSTESITRPPQPRRVWPWHVWPPFLWTCTDTRACRKPWKLKDNG